MNRRLGFVTSEIDPQCIADDHLVFEPLSHRGFDVTPVVWDHTHPRDLAAFDALIFRSCWNYHRKPREFAAWCQSLAALAIPVFNPVPLLAWNFHKRYLLELARRDVAIPRAVLIDADCADVSMLLLGFLSQGSSEHVVVKPAVSMSGYDTYRIARNDVTRIESLVREIQSGRDVIVQDFIEEVLVSGEVSFVFFDGVFSHAVRKTPRAGEFRVQEEHGGRRELHTPDNDEIEQVAAIHAAIPGTPLYARIDVVRDRDRYVVMEVEAIDPMLFFETSPGAAERFAEAIASRLQR